MKKVVINWWKLFGILILVLAAILLIEYMLCSFIPDLPRQPEIVLPALLIFGLLSLIVILVFIFVIFRVVGASDNTKAFGLPEGSIRATIALGLILIFSILSVFLYYQVKQGNTGQLQGLTKEQFQSIPLEQIVSSRYYFTSDNGSSGNMSSSNLTSELYDVVVVRKNQASDDLAKQLITTIGTLIVAVAGFYFGTKAVTTGRQTQDQTQPKPETTPVIEGIDPNEGLQGKKDLDIEITGSNFITPSKVILTHDTAPGMVLKNFTSNESSIKGQLSIPDNQPPDKYGIRVVNFDGVTGSKDNAFTVIKKPEEKEQPEGKTTAEEENPPEGEKLPK